MFTVWHMMPTSEGTRHPAEYPLYASTPTLEEFIFQVRIEYTRPWRGLLRWHRALNENPLPLPSSLYRLIRDHDERTHAR